ncbi:MAG: hypothetical protein N4A74_02635, partial [Carboxylicivirga sp.]|nr:hypothetical protein [Carboxylicivirga sp.]
MKKKNTLTAVVISIIFAVLSTSCLKDQFESIEVPKKEEVGYEGFDFATISSLDLTINTEGSDGKSVEGVVVEVFSSNPLLANGLYTSNANAHKIFKGRT